MRRDILGHNWHPQSSVPIYHQDISMLGFAFYMAKKYPNKSDLLTISVMNNLASTTRCGYFMNNSGAFQTMYEYFANGGDYNYSSLETKWSWKSPNFQFSNGHPYATEISDADSLTHSELQVIKDKYQEMFSKAVLLFAANLGKAANLMHHWAFNLNTHVYKEIVEALKPKIENQNPLIEGISASANGYLYATDAFAFLTLIPYGQSIISKNLSDLNDSLEWLSQAVPLYGLQSYKTYQQNPIPTMDWISL